MKNFHCWTVCASFVFLSSSFSPVAALEKADNPHTGIEIPDSTAPPGCVTFKINPRRLYAPFKIQVRTNQFKREFLFEDPGDKVFDKTAKDNNVLADSTLIINYIDRKGRVVPGGNEAGRASGSIWDCTPEISLDFGLKATAGSFDRLNDSDEDSASRRAKEYYYAIDPDRLKTTLDDWKRENGFFVANSPTEFEDADLPPDIRFPQPSSARVKRKSKKVVRQRSSKSSALVIGQAEQQGNLDDAKAVYFNHGDLGFGRDMHMKRSGKNNKNIAFYVTNYRSLEDAIDRDDPIATVAMEYSYGSRTGKGRSRYVQFYAFNGKGDRIESADLDGRGEKYLPNLCMTCHGGKFAEKDPEADPPKSDIPEFGGLGARFLPFDLNAFDFSESNSRYSRATQEASFKTMNEALLDAFPTEAMTQLIRGWYTDIVVSNTPATLSDTSVNLSKRSRTAQVKVRPRTGIAAQSGVTPEIQTQSVSTSNLNRSTQDSAYVPAGWRGEHAELYTEIVAPYCRGCHITRLDDLNWTTYEKFANSVKSIYIKGAVCANSTHTMPNAKATYQNMWLSSVDPIDVFTRHDIFEVASGETCGQGPWARN